MGVSFSGYSTLSGASLPGFVGTQFCQETWKERFNRLQKQLLRPVAAEDASPCALAGQQTYQTH